jgi:hypothetical protein
MNMILLYLVAELLNVNFNSSLDFLVDVKLIGEFKIRLKLYCDFPKSVK